MQRGTAMFRWLESVLLLSILLAPTLVFAGEDRVDIELTFPNGASPKVFTEGWTFGVKATLNAGSERERDLGPQVMWSGSGTFSPMVGPVSSPRFTAEGGNVIELTVVVYGKTYTRKFEVQAVKPNHATVGHKAYCPADSHGCPGCPHPVVGPILKGNPKVLIGGKPVICVGATGIHASCCGPNTFEVVQGDPEVLVDGKPVARLGDRTKHCGGMGNIVAPEFVLTRKFSGTFSGNARGTAKFAILGSQVKGTFTGTQSLEGSGSVNVTLNGTYEIHSGKATGKVTGTAVYTASTGKPATATVSGTFEGDTQGSSFNGTWEVVGKGEWSREAGGSFSTVLSVGGQ